MSAPRSSSAPGGDPRRAPELNRAMETVLRGAEAGSLLAMALGSAGLQLQRWDLERVYTRPGAESSGRYRVRAGGQGLTMIASTLTLSEAEREGLGAVRCESALGTAHVWAHPVDPRLPGLAVAEDDGELAARLRPVVGEQVSVVAREMLVLRPLRRAVYRVRLRSRLGERELYLKVLRPDRAAALVARHAAWPLAPAAADAGDGIVVIEAAHGAGLLHFLYHRGERGRPGVVADGLADPESIDLAAVLEARRGIAAQALGLPGRTPASARLAEFAETAIVAGAPPRRLERLVTAIDGLLRPPPGPVTAIHGDYHPGNIFLAPTGHEVTAVIDVDTLGPGDRIDDDAVLLAHLHALPGHDTAGYAAVPAVRERLWRILAAEHDPENLAARTGATVLSLLPGARSAFQAEELLTAAEGLVARVGPAAAAGR